MEVEGSSRSYHWQEGPSYSTNQVHSFTLTNSFTPYNVLSLQSSFTDDSADSSSTGKINKVKYTLVNNTTGAEITTPAVTKNTDGT